MKGRYTPIGSDSSELSVYLTPCLLKLARWVRCSLCTPLRSLGPGFDSLP